MSSTGTSPAGPAPASRAPLWRRAVSALLKVVAATALVWLLLRSGRLDVSVLGRALSRPGAFPLAAAAVALTAIAGIVMGIRFRYLLAHRGVRLGLWETVGLTLGSNLVGLVLPGMVGADAMRVTYLAGRAHERRADALTAVFVDRVIGLVALFALAAVMSPILALTGTARLPATIAWLAPVLTLASLVPIAIIAIPGLSTSALLRRLLDRLPPWVSRVGAALRGYARSPRVLVVSIALSVISHALVVAAYGLAGLVLHDRLPYAAHFALDPLALVLNAVPLTPGGIGIAESAFSLLYERAGSALGGTVGLLGRALQYAGIAVAGVPALLLMRSPLRRAEAEASPETGS